MDLRELRGIGGTYHGKLLAAGIASAEELAWVADIDALARRAGVPRARLAQAQAEAARACGRRAPASRRALRVVAAAASRLVKLSVEEIGRRVSSRRSG